MYDYDEIVGYNGFLDLLRRASNLYNNGVINEYSVNILSNTYHISMISDGYGGASLSGIFGKGYDDVNGFFDMLVELEEDYLDDLGVI